jgi:hypothetical protein
LERTIAIIRRQRAAREPLRELDGVDEALLGTQGAKAPDLAGREEEDDEERVEDRRGRLEDVVVVRGHELSKLVDERPKASAARDGRDQARGRHRLEEQQDDRDEHPEAAPEHMRDVQAAAKLRYPVASRKMRITTIAAMAETRNVSSRSASAARVRCLNGILSIRRF